MSCQKFLIKKPRIYSSRKFLFKGGCDNNPCFQGVTCTNIGGSGASYKCGDCPKGYIGDGKTCTDINEVKISTLLINNSFYIIILITYELLSVTSKNLATFSLHL